MDSRLICTSLLFWGSYFGIIDPSNIHILKSYVLLIYKIWQKLLYQCILVICTCYPGSVRDDFWRKKRLKDEGNWCESLMKYIHLWKFQHSRGLKNCVQWEDTYRTDDTSNKATSVMKIWKTCINIRVQYSDQFVWAIPHTEDLKFNRKFTDLSLYWHCMEILFCKVIQQHTWITAQVQIIRVYSWNK